jgi:hypothetical protein
MPFGLNGHDLIAWRDMSEPKSAFGIGRGLGEMPASPSAPKGHDRPGHRDAVCVADDAGE